MADNRRCNHPEHPGERYLPVGEFHKQGRRNGKQHYRSICKTCTNKDLREKYRDEGRSGGWPVEKKKAYVRARSRSVTRIIKLYPEMYQRIMREELAKEPQFTKREAQSYRRYR